MSTSLIFDRYYWEIKFPFFRNKTRDNNESVNSWSVQSWKAKYLNEFRREKTKRRKICAFYCCLNSSTSSSWIGNFNAISSTRSLFYRSFFPSIRNNLIRSSTWRNGKKNEIDWNNDNSFFFVCRETRARSTVKNIWEKKSRGFTRNAMHCEFNSNSEASTLCDDRRVFLSCPSQYQYIKLLCLIYGQREQASFWKVYLTFNGFCLHGIALMAKCAWLGSLRIEI